MYQGKCITSGTVKLVNKRHCLQKTKQPLTKAAPFTKIMFQEIEFENACAELDNADVEGWEFFTESHDVKIYRQYSEVNSYELCRSETSYRVILTFRGTSNNVKVTSRNKSLVGDEWRPYLRVSPGWQP